MRIKVRTRVRIKSEDQSEDRGEDEGEDQSGGRDPANLSDCDPAVVCPSVVTKSLRQRRSACSE